MFSQPHSGLPSYLEERVTGSKPPYDGRPVRLGPGDDTYFDDDGFDKVYGGDGDDSIHGQLGDDKLKGGDGDDSLFGENGSDYLIGGAGDDQLNGGKGRNYLYGGNGSDDINLGPGQNESVIYHDVSESLPGETHDTIRGFETTDGSRLDLRRIDADSLTPEDDAFSWIGNAAFSGTPGELRFDPKVSVSLLQGDVNGDGTADFEVYFLTFSPLHLTEADFKL